MKWTPLWIALAINLMGLAPRVAQADVPKEEAELSFLPKGTQLTAQREVLIPQGVNRVFFQKGLATTEADAINGNLRYCFMLLKTPSTRERVLERDTTLVTAGTYRSSTATVELQIDQPLAVFSLGCINGPSDFDKRPTIGQFKKEVQGIFEVIMPGPEPIN